jgi:hypothetical protein
MLFLKVKDMLGQKVFTNCVQAFVGTEAAFMVSIDVRVVEITRHEKTIKHSKI